MAGRIIQGWLAVMWAVNLAASGTLQSRLPDFVMGKNPDENLPVYAGPDAADYPVGRLPPGTILRVDTSLSGTDWLCVYPHEELNAWIYGDCVKKGVVVLDRSRVRARCSLFSPLVTVLSKGTRIEIRGKYGDWYRIRPPRTSRFWVIRSRTSTAGVRRVESAEPAKKREPGPAPQSVPVLSPPPELAGFTLLPDFEQGWTYRGEAVLDWSIGDGPPSPFCLVKEGSDGKIERICQIVLSEREYAVVIGSRLYVTGSMWRVQGSDYPVLVPYSVRILPEKGEKGKN